MWSSVIGLSIAHSSSVQPQVRPVPPSSREAPFSGEPNGVIKSARPLPVSSVKTAAVVNLDDVVEQIFKASRSNVQADQIALLNDSLNAAVLEAPCMGGRQYQVRILQLGALLDAIPASDEWRQLRCDLTKHLLHTKEEAEWYYDRSFLQGFWPLHAEILTLPGVMPDAFANAIGSLREMLQNEKPNSGWAGRTRELLPKLLPPASFRLPNDQKVVEGLVQSCTSLMFAVKAVPHLERVKASLEMIRKGYQALLEGSRHIYGFYQLSAPGLYSLKLKVEEEKTLFQPGDEGFVRTNRGLCYRSEAHQKGAMPSEQDWARLVLGQLLGYYRDVFTFVKVSGCAQDGGAPFSYVLRVSYDNSHRGLSEEERSLQFVISLLAGASENVDEEFLTCSVSYSVRDQLQKISAEEFVLDCLALLEQHSQNYDRWARRELLGQDDLYIEKGCAMPIPVYVSEDFATAIYDRLRRLVDLLKDQATHGELLAAMALPVEPAKTKQSITRAVMGCLQTLNLEGFSIAGRVAVVGKVLTSFPVLSSCLALPGLASRPDTRAEFFCEAVKQGHILLVSRFLDEERQAKLEPEQKSLLKQVFENNDTALLIAVRQLDVEMVRLLLSYGLPVKDVVSASFRCMVNFSKAPLRAAAIITCLLDHIPGPYLNKGAGMGRWTLFHHLAYLSEEMSEIVEPLMIQLARYGACPNILSGDGTALDLALKEKNRRICHRLIGLGATCAPSFKSVASNLLSILAEDAFITLQARDLALRWRLGMAAFGKDLVEEEAEIKNNNHEGSLCGPHIEPTPLPKWVLNNPKLFQRQHNSVASIFNSGLSSESWHFGDCRELLDPLFSTMSHGAFEPHFFDIKEELGSRFAVQSFFDLLVIPGIAHSELVQVSCTAGSPLTVLMVQKIEGDILTDVLKQPDQQSSLDSLDPSAFSHLILTSLLLDFEEIKSDSFVVESLPNGTSRLVCINPTSAFFHINRTSEDRSPIRNVLFCLDQMLEKVHPTARQLFLAVNPYRLISTWLDRLAEQDNKCGQLFEHKDRYAPGQVRFASGFITNLCNKIRRLQTLLTKFPEPTHLDLLVLLNPAWGKYYTRAFNFKPDPLDRFASLWCSDEKIKDYDGITRQNGLRRTSSCSIRRLVDLAGARKEFGAVIYEEKTAPKQFEIMRKNLQEGDSDEIEAFERLKLDSSKQAVVAGFDFTNLNTLGPYTRQQMLKVIFQGYYFSMSLNGLATLELSEIQMLINHSPYLQALTLEAVQFLPDVLREFSRAKYLRSLTLISLNSLWKVNLSNCAIRDLHVERCCNLEELHVPLSLKRLYLNDCSELDAVRVGGENEGQYQSENFLTELSIQNCTKLQPWERLFFPWYKKEQAASIYLTHVPVRPITRTLWHVIQAIAKAPKSHAILNALKASEENALGKYIDVLGRYVHRSVEELELPATRITDDDLEVFGGWFPQLKSLKLMGAKELPGVVSDAGLRAFIRNSSCLTSLEIAFCPQVTGIEKIVSELPGLLALTIRYCPAKDIVLQQIAQHRHNIRRLAFIGCKEISDEGLVALAHQCKQLEGIDFGGCVEITDRGLGVLLRNNPALSSLDVSGCTKLHASLHESIDACRLRLRHMNLSLLHKAEVITHTLTALSKHGEELRSLSLSRCSYEVSSLEICLKVCRNLVYLDLSHGGHLVETDFASISDHVLQLETLNLAFCKISDQGFTNLLRSCENLEILDLSSCRGITKNSLKAIVNWVPRLKVLKFQFASIQGNIRREDLLALQQSKPDLRIESNWRANINLS